MNAVGPNARVVLSYELRADTGELLDASDRPGGEPMVYVHGYGMLVPGLERALVGLRVGDATTVVVSPDEGYGDHDAELVMEVARADMPRPDRVAPGDELVAESEEGDEALLHVVAVEGDTVVLDGNHPLAGKTLHYQVVVRELREATDAEIADAAGGFDEAGDLETAAASGLVQLRRPS